MASSLCKVKKQIGKNVPARVVESCGYKMGIKYTMTNRARMRNALKLFTKFKVLERVFITKNNVTMGFLGLSKRKIKLFEADGWTIEFGDSVERNEKMIVVIEGIRFEVDPVDKRYRNGVIAIVNVLGRNKLDCEEKVQALYTKIDKILDDNGVVYDRQCEIVGLTCEHVYEKKGSGQEERAMN